MTETLGFAPDDTALVAMDDDELRRQFDAAERAHRQWWARAIALQAEIRRRRLFAERGLRTTATWTAARNLSSDTTAANQVRVGAACERLPSFAEAVQSGELSPDQAIVIARRATPDSVGEMLDAARNEDSIRGLRHAVSKIAAAHPQPHVDPNVAPGDDPDLAVQPPPSMYRPSEVRTTLTLEGRILVFGDFATADGEFVVAQLRAATEAEPATGPDGTRIPYRRRMAQAMLRVLSGESAPPPANVVVHVHARTESPELYAVSASGEPVDLPVLERLGCDATFRPILYGDRNSIGIGRANRRIPDGLAAVIRSRDGHRCRFPGCANTLWLQIHHIKSWAEGGQSNAGNLVLLCSYHHRLVHDEGWQSSGTADALIFSAPDGTRYESPANRPRGPSG